MESATATPRPVMPLLRSLLLECAILLTATLLLSATNSALGLSWRRPPDVRTFPIPQAHKTNPDTLLWLDVRDPDRFASAHIPGAMLFSETHPTESLEELLRRWHPRQKIIVYGEGSGSERAERVAKKLQKDLQTREIYVLEGGWSAWPRK